jgi:hypothetical protein
MESEPRARVVVDTEKNRLLITLSATVSKEEIERIYTDVVVCVPELRPGFNVITDLTRCKIGHLSGLPTFREIMELLLEKKVGKVVRVVGKAKLIFNQISRITERLKGYRPIYVSTMQQAEEELSVTKNKAVI